MFQTRSFITCMEKTKVKVEKLPHIDFEYIKISLSCTSQHIINIYICPPN